jgi:NAD(P)-dependent dehydrogenase (short-subunit alcohol dehydrogenase family)
MNRAVLITGASSGIGRACALHLDALGFRVFAGVRNPAAADDLRRAGSSGLCPVTLDVTSAECIASVAGEVRQALGSDPLIGLVNNAGVGYGGPIEYLPLERFRQQFEVNLFGPVAVIQAFLPLLRLARSPRIVNIGSVQGRAVTPFLAPYTCSKFALEALTGTLRQELAPWGIHVCIVEPGIVRTAMFSKAVTQLARLREILPVEALDRYGHAVAPFERALEAAPRKGSSPDGVARAVARALTARRPKTRYVVGLDARLLTFLCWLLPDRAWDYLMSKLGIVKS